MPVPPGQRELQVAYAHRFIVEDPTRGRCARIRLWENAVPILERLSPRPATAATIISASAITPRPQARPRDSPGLSFRRALPRFVAKGPDQFQTRPVW